MFDTIGRSFDLFRICLSVLSLNKELLFFPLLAIISLLGFMLACVTIAFSTGSLAGISVIGLIIGLLFLLYILAFPVGIFFNAALVLTAHRRLTGGDPSISSGLRGAACCIPSLLMWAVISATVGLILLVLSFKASRSGGTKGTVQRLVVGVLGASWDNLTYFVVPLMVIERSSFFDSFGSSVALVRRTWGEQVVAAIGFGALQLFVSMTIPILAVVLAFLVSPLGPNVFNVATLLVVGLFVLTTLIFAALKGIYKAALYYYATTGEVPSHFPSVIVRYAFIEE